jgi:hypothetical protein
MPGIDQKNEKQAIKEAYKEWLNEQFAEFGKFTAKSLAAAFFIGVAWLFAKSKGIL